MQNMFFDFKRDKAKFVPIVSVAGRAGGTTIVIRSRARMMKDATRGPSGMKLTNDAMKPRPAIMAMTDMYRNESR